MFGSGKIEENAREIKYKKKKKKENKNKLFLYVTLNSFNLFSLFDVKIKSLFDHII